MTFPTGVSFVVPVLNGRRWLPRVIGAVRAQTAAQRPEIIVVDDGSTDGSWRWLQSRAESDGLVLLRGRGRGAAAALNAGIREARHPVICQVDQDVILEPGWLAALLAALQDPDVAAAQGHYIVAPGAGFWARTMGRDLEWRYASMGRVTDHVCTGNTAYRASALHAVGLFDERLGYGYDNDLSYRLLAAGYRLEYCAAARSVHMWRDGAAGYLRQQFGVGYGRLDVVAKHRSRVRGDTVSNSLMMAHAPLTLAALLLALAGLAVPLAAPGGAAILGFLLLERAVSGVRAAHLTRDPVALAFPATHLARNLAWCAAILAWAARRLSGAPSEPGHSMHRLDLRPHVAQGFSPAPAALKGCATPTTALKGCATAPAARQLLVVVPAYNEADSLPHVVRQLRRGLPWADVLVVNDGSSDHTADVLPSLDVAWLTLSTRVGVGGAVRTGLRYAVQHGYRYAARIDGDGQHRVSDIRRLLSLVASDELDAVTGSRFLGRRAPVTLLRGAQVLLGAFLGLATGRRITDPTSGLFVAGPRALGLLARHHPTGYAEPELILLLHRNRLRTGEVPIRSRPRRRGRTSLTPGRAVVACGRTLLALLVAPPRREAAGGEPS